MRGKMPPRRAVEVPVYKSPADPSARAAFDDQLSDFPYNPWEYVPNRHVEPPKKTVSSDCPIPNARSEIVRRAYAADNTPYYALRIWRETGHGARLEEKNVHVFDVYDYVSRRQVEDFETRVFNEPQLGPDASASSGVAGRAGTASRADDADVGGMSIIAAAIADSEPDDESSEGEYASRVLGLGNNVESIEDDSYIGDMPYYRVVFEGDEDDREGHWVSEGELTKHLIERDEFKMLQNYWKDGIRGVSDPE
ncbi:hypothetical protein BDY21DRAFT_346708 [Lineolata rhizophorae]|uniref:Chromo domain-containing protein n=1 Tax=Lineolata rhizophorae TaxID=578093 RepID=A0A6A6NZ77_9PEZI|nr:hypothetical protein BDY21DRAFT_346708 [Lineolata rhizophorae]